MLKKTSLALVVAFLVYAGTPTPAWSQLQNCFVCHCCDQICAYVGAFMGGGGAYGYAQQSCNWEGSCHSPCGQTEESPEVATFDFEGVWAELKSFDVEGIQHQLKTHPDRVAFNREREAIQVLGCNSAVVGHLQLPKSLADALTTGEGL